MAEPIGMVSGLLTLSSFAFNSSVALYNTVKSFKTLPRRVRSFLDELEALSSVLRSLNETLTLIDVDLSVLDLPLQRCGDACKEFEDEIIGYLSRSGGSKTNFRDWGKLKYMGDDIDGFTTMIANYKSTIIIALADANLRKSSITAETLKEYQDMIKNATDDLEAHLMSIDEKLESVFEHTVAEPDEDAAELRLIKAERLSTQKCLEICSQLSDHINMIQHSRSASRSRYPEPLPDKIFNSGLQDCQNNLGATAAQLEKYMYDLVDRMVAKSKTTMSSEDDIAYLARLREQWETTRRGIDICSKADSYLKENISMIENHATGDDTIQVLVSTNDKTIHGKNRGFGLRQKQIGGHMADMTVQQLSRDIWSRTVHNAMDNEPSPRMPVPIVPDDVPEEHSSSDFNERYGKGFKLPPKSNEDITMPTEHPAVPRVSRGQTP